MRRRSEELGDDLSQQRFDLPIKGNEHQGGAINEICFRPVDSLVHQRY